MSKSRQTLWLTLVCVAVGASACATEEMPLTQSVQGGDEALAGATQQWARMTGDYLLTRQNYTLASPSSNALLNCADGLRGAMCGVAELDVAALRLSASREARFLTLTDQGEVLVRGSWLPGWASLPKFRVTSAYVNVLPRGLSNYFSEGCTDTVFLRPGTRVGDFRRARTLDGATSFSTPLLPDVAIDNRRLLYAAPGGLQDYLPANGALSNPALPVDVRTPVYRALRSRAGVLACVADGGAGPGGMLYSAELNAVLVPVSAL